jgi:hypothetical protein
VPITSPGAHRADGRNTWRGHCSTRGATMMSGGQEVCDETRSLSIHCANNGSQYVGNGDENGDRRRYDGNNQDNTSR